MRKKMNPVISYLLIAFIAVLGALNYEIFIFPNNFASAGLNGILTIIRYLTGFNFGYMSLILNIPLLLISFKVLNRRFAINTFVYVVCFSATSIILRDIDLSRIVFVAKDGGERIMAAIAAGVFNGAFMSVALRLGGSTGGMDIVAGFINHHRPEFSMVGILFVLNNVVAAVSFFAYGMDYVPVILCIVYSFVTTRMSNSILKGVRAAIKFEVVTSQPEELAKDLMSNLRHGCTVVPATGMYSHEKKSMLVCVVNRLQVADFEHIISKYKDAFVMVSSIYNTYGNFKHIK